MYQGLLAKEKHAGKVMLTFINRWLKKGLFKSPESGGQLLKIKETLTSPSWSSSLDTKNDRRSKMRYQTKHSF